MAQSSYDRDLDRNPANSQPLTPLTFLERAAEVFPERLAIAHGRLRRNYRDFHTRSKKLASALTKRGFVRGDTVAAMLANTPAMFECHYGVPMCGAVLNTLNTRLDAAAVAFMLDHGEAKGLIVDREFSLVIAEALKLAKVRPLVIDYDDPEYDGPGERIGEIGYEDLLAEGDEAYRRTAPIDEWDAITLNYTSGTTGDPKGVVYHHRGANLLAMGNVITADMRPHPVYLWTLPMFHCNGWCFPWSISVKAGTHVCLREGRPVPGIAPAAKQEGAYVTKAIRARLGGQPAPPFRYQHAGDLATIGKRRAVIDFGWIKLRGAIAWWLWGFAHIYFLIGVRNRLSVALNWLWIYARDQRSARLITQGGGRGGGLSRRDGPMNELQWRVYSSRGHRTALGSWRGNSRSSRVTRLSCTGETRPALATP